MAAALAVPAAILLVILVGGLASAVPAQASPAEQASSGRLSVTIDAMNPSYAVPGARVTLSGTVTNGTRQTRAGLNVQLYTSASPFTTRDGLDAYMSHGVVSDLIPAGKPFVISADVASGATASWTASFRASTQGISSFGVYAVTAQLQDPYDGVISSDQTLLPSWPGSRSAGLTRPLAISWLLPLIDQPHQKVCTATLTSNGLTSSLGQDGRLSALLEAGASHPGARPTWFIDPALLSDMATMTGRYLVGGQPTCTLASREPASAAAASWLAGLRQVMAAGQSAVLTPYANVDMAALVHQGLTRDLAAAYQTGEAVATSVLHKSIRHDIAWPPGGTADLSLLTNLAAHQHVGTVVLNSDEMPPVVDAASVFQPDDAVASLRVAGLPMNVLLSDDTLTKVLKAGNTSSGTLPRSTEFAVRQRFLAETAMIAAEAPDSERTIVVAPPGNWSPTKALASDLLGETQTAPWLTPTPLASLSSAPDTQRAAPRHPPPASQPSPGELSRDYLGQVRILGDRVGVYKSMLYKPAESYTRSLDEALLATESAAWRGSGEPQGAELVRGLSSYITAADKKVTIIPSGQVPMGGSSGLVPVSIQNGLHQAIQVRVVATVVNTLGRTSQLTIGHYQNQVIIPPQQPATVRMPVSSAPQGSTEIQLVLTSANGTMLPFTHTSLTVLSTRYGRAILFLIGAAIGVLVLTSIYRGVRRWLHGDGHLVNEEPDPPGSVMTGTSGARHPTEAPDDLADARRWVDDA
jgi:Family of unknown function (DUF6049)